MVFQNGRPTEVAKGCVESPPASSHATYVTQQGRQMKYASYPARSQLPG